MLQETQPLGGHDGPYDAPVEIHEFALHPDWIDYNGHMNVGYYGVAFDMAFERLLVDHLGLGEPQVQALGQGPYVLQSHMQFLREVTDDMTIYFQFRLLDADHKRGHYFGQMISAPDQTVCATQEVLFMNVSHRTGRSEPYPDWAVTRLARMVSDHASLPPTPQIGQPIGIRRK
ncbi:MULTISPECIES: thioesterase family protein [unclassified Ruegeria]|uniref:thioesterase family protein n=1 Tax=unclassified Ruegeria TaxID=2625375 RepID=UPI001492FE9B|nr:MULTISPECIES: thioesterase family protein [unclassified Ruegeria]NOD77165.1 thioesterase [Ruegeria sp. HKCCD4332]NOD89636.1 thioesterase [Ruegeria sp. HKCCD4318]NOE13959.1 thioesterase [Ruegeria sp. HKCCD4318-2]NOG08104.1 thioesterase [Ruegeria sp. HKCCD4315]